MARHFEFRCLLDYLGGALAVNTWVRPTPRVCNGELQDDEVAEAVYMEVIEPVTALGVEEELQRIIIVADEHELGDYVSINGIRATNMMPLKQNTLNQGLVAFGTPMSNNPLASTTIKYTRELAVHAMAGPTIPITLPWRVRIWGYVYTEEELWRVFGVMGGHGMPSGVFARVNDHYRNRVLDLMKSPIPVSFATWKTLPGGFDQQVPKINPWIRYAQNAAATLGLQEDYEFRFDTGNVATSAENMRHEFTARDALLVKNLGVKGAGTLARFGLRIGGNYHPQAMTDRVSLFPTTALQNMLNFGHRFPFWPVAVLLYDPIPRLPSPYLIWNEIGEVIMRDDGTGVLAANAIRCALAGTRIEMTS